MKIFAPRWTLSENCRQGSGHAAGSAPKMGMDGAGVAVCAAWGAARSLHPGVGRESGTGADWVRGAGAGRDCVADAGDASAAGPSVATSARPTKAQRQPAACHTRSASGTSRSELPNPATSRPLPFSAGPARTRSGHGRQAPPPRWCRTGSRCPRGRPGWRP